MLIYGFLLSNLESKIVGQLHKHLIGNQLQLVNNKQLVILDDSLNDHPNVR